MKLYRFEKLLDKSISAVIELQNELYESSKACWDDDRNSLEKRCDQLADLEVELCTARAEVRGERQAKAKRHGRRIKGSFCTYCGTETEEFYMRADGTQACVYCK